MLSYNDKYFRNYFSDYNHICIYGAGCYGALLYDLIRDINPLQQLTVFDDYRTGKLKDAPICNSYNSIPIGIDLIIVSLSDLEQGVELARKMSSRMDCQIILLNNKLRDALDKRLHGAVSPSKGLIVDFINRVQGFRISKLNAEYLKFVS